MVYLQSSCVIDKLFCVLAFLLVKNTTSVILILAFMSGVFNLDVYWNFSKNFIR